MTPSYSRSVHSATYKADPEKKKNVENEVDKMVKQGVAEPAMSEWASQVVFFTRKYRSLRFSLDYCCLNAITVLHSYPITRTDKCMDSLDQGKLFSTLDANSEYSQIETDKTYMNKNLFVRIHELYNYNHMEFGLTNAPANFQRAMDAILATMK